MTQITPNFSSESIRVHSNSTNTSKVNVVKVEPEQKSGVMSDPIQTINSSDIFKITPLTVKDESAGVKLKGDAVEYCNSCRSALENCRGGIS